MSSEFEMSISIPTDDEGYVLLQCPICGTYFKISPSDYRDDSILDIFCPCCGLASDSYITEDVLDLAEAMARNFAKDMLYNELKKIERQTQRGSVRIKAGGKPKHEVETPIQSGIDALEVSYFSCCKRTAKIKPLLKMTGCYCPFCGVKEYEIK